MLLRRAEQACAREGAHRRGRAADVSVSTFVTDDRASWRTPTRKVNRAS